MEHYKSIINNKLFYSYNSNKLFLDKMILENTNYYNKQLKMTRNLFIIIVFNELLLKLLFYNVELHANVELGGAATSNGRSIVIEVSTE
jgi:hypothetical protein